MECAFLIHELRQIVETKFFFGTQLYEPRALHALLKEKLCDTILLALLHCASKKPYPQVEWNIWNLLHGTTTSNSPNYHLFTRALKQYFWNASEKSPPVVHSQVEPSQSYSLVPGSPLRYWLELAYLNHSLAVALWNTVVGKNFDDQLLSTAYEADAFLLRIECRYLLFLILLAIDKNQPDIYYSLHDIMFLSSNAGLHETIMFAEEAAEALLCSKTNTLPTFDHGAVNTALPCPVVDEEHTDTHPASSFPSKSLLHVQVGSLTDDQPLPGEISPLGERFMDFSVMNDARMTSTLSGSIIPTALLDDSGHGTFYTPTLSIPTSSPQMNTESTSGLGPEDGVEGESRAPLLHQSSVVHDYSTLGQHFHSAAFLLHSKVDQADPPSHSTANPSPPRLSLRHTRTDSLMNFPTTKTSSNEFPTKDTSQTLVTDSSGRECELAEDLRASFVKHHRRIQSDQTLELRRSLTLQVEGPGVVESDGSVAQGDGTLESEAAYNSGSLFPLGSPSETPCDYAPSLFSDGGSIAPLEFHNTLGRECAHFEMANYLIRAMEAIACERELFSLSGANVVPSTGGAFSRASSRPISPPSKAKTQKPQFERQTSIPQRSQRQASSLSSSLSPSISSTVLNDCSQSPRQTACTSPHSYLEKTLSQPLSYGSRSRHDSSVYSVSAFYPLNPGDAETVAASVLWSLDLSSTEVQTHLQPRVLRDLYMMRDVTGAPHLPTVAERERWIEMRHEETQQRLMRHEKIASSSGSASVAASLLASYPSPREDSSFKCHSTASVSRREFFPVHVPFESFCRSPLNVHLSSIASDVNLSSEQFLRKQATLPESDVGGRPIPHAKRLGRCESSQSMIMSPQSQTSANAQNNDETTSTVPSETVPLKRNVSYLSQQRVPTTSSTSAQDWATQIHTHIVDKNERATKWKKQGNKCPGCGIEVADAFIKRMRFCEYYGMYFCTVCHTNRLMLVPGHILHSWNFTMFPVSVLASQMLERIHTTHATFNVMQFNPSLVTKVNSLRNLELLRTQLGLLKPFLQVCCRAAPEKAELQQLPAHWSENYIYTMADFELIKVGIFAERLTTILTAGMKHVRHCELCQGRGHVCEVCHSQEILFPFQWSLVQSAASNTRSKTPLASPVVQCHECGACYHRKCYTGPPENCRKCARRRQYQEHRASPNNTPKPL